MKEWIKDIIKSEPRVYLTLSTPKEIRVIPYSYSYVKGKLIGSIPVILADEIAVLRTHPYQYLTFDTREHKLGILGKLTLHRDNLDRDWKNYHSIFTDLFSEKPNSELMDLPHLQKAVVLEFIPTRIDYTEDGQRQSIEMEIVP